MATSLGKAQIISFSSSHVAQRWRFYFWSHLEPGRIFCLWNDFWLSFTGGNSGGGWWRCRWWLGCKLKYETGGYFLSVKAHWTVHSWYNIYQCCWCKNINGSLIIYFCLTLQFCSDQASWLVEVWRKINLCRYFAWLLWQHHLTISSSFVTSN